MMMLSLRLKRLAGKLQNDKRRKASHKGCSMRRAAKVDRNQAEIAAALRNAGATVQSLAAVGDGVPDLLVGFRRATYLLEVKDGKKPPSARELTECQINWHASWFGGPCVVVTSAAEALAAIGATA